MIKEKTFYKSFMVLALSLALQNLLTYGVNLMDTMMLGRYSQDAMGGVSTCLPPRNASICSKNAAAFAPSK